MSSTYTFIADLFAQLPDLSPDTIISRTLYSDDRVKAVLFGFAAGQELSEHTASSPALLHILRGEAQLTLGSDAMDAHAGTWAHMPAQLPHSVFAKTPVVMLLLLLKDAGRAAG
jgi:quercetin dioxygenase-like cupin family protein